MAISSNQDINKAVKTSGVAIAYIRGVNPKAPLKDKTRGEIALTYIKGIGRSSSKKILAEANVNPDLPISEWTDSNFQAIRSIISRSYKIAGDLDSMVFTNIKRLIDIGCYRGKRHKLGLPVNGQRTKTNARTRKGKPKTVAGKKKATK